MIEALLESIHEEIRELEEHIPNLHTPLRADLFSISGHPHYETVLSNWFCYFLESDNKNSFSGLFSECFKELIIEQTSEASLDWLNDQIHCLQEFQTIKGNYIDLVVYNDKTDDKAFEDALIIEHKVGADLYNDLKDYYNSVSVIGEKYGVVLSAKEIVALPKNYVNISYQRLLERIENKLGVYALSSELNNLAYLRDFINNIKRMSIINKTESLKFCFEHGNTIAKVAQIKLNAEVELADLLKSALEPTRFKFARRNAYSFSIRTNDDHISLVIELDKLFSEKTCNFQYWLYKEATAMWNNVPDHSSLKRAYGDQFDIRKKLKGKDWVELLRGTISFEDIDADKSADKVLIDYLETVIYPLNDFVREEMKRYNS